MRPSDPRMTSGARTTAAAWRQVPADASSPVSVEAKRRLDPVLAALASWQWEQLYALWNSGNATTATICINNQCRC